MSNIKNKVESFKLQFEKFLIGCDSVEEQGMWNKEEYGEMETYFTVDLTGIIIHLIASDGEITEKEAGYLNDCFGFTYTAEELKSIYNEFGDAFASLFDEDITGGFALLKAINRKLAQAYVNMLVTVCEIVAESDLQIKDAEKDILEKLKLISI